MNESEALSLMVPPSQRRPGKPRGGVIQIWVTRSCDKSCFHCTQGSNFGGNPGKITPEQFETACVSLKDYFGIVGVFGGNPALHPQFDTLCEILAKHIPFERRGLWCNNPFGHGAKMRETFNPSVSNLNVHFDQEAYDEFKRDWPESRPFGLHEDSRHSPVYVAMKDVITDEETCWDYITNCDINRHWSAMIGVFRGELRGWFCEIAGAQAMLHQDDPDYPDTGIPIPTPHGEKPWWDYPMDYYATQVRKHCLECGVPLRGYGNLAQATDGAEQVSATHASIARPKKRERPVEIVSTLDELQSKALRFTEYLQGANK